MESDVEILLAINYGLGHFLPLSTALHDELLKLSLAWPHISTETAIAIYFGLSLGIIMYLWQDVANITSSIWQMVKGKKRGNQLGYLLGIKILSSFILFPFAWFIYSNILDKYFSLQIAGWVCFVLGIVLLVADRVGMTVARISHMGFQDSIIIGIVQCLGIIPGAGTATMSIISSRFIGFERVDTLRINLLFSLPITLFLLGESIYSWVINHGAITFMPDKLMTSFSAFITCIIMISFTQAWLKRGRFTFFAYYRIMLGGGILTYAYTLG